MIYVTQLCTAASNTAKREELLIVLFDMKVFYKDCFQNDRKNSNRHTYKRKCSVQGLSEAHPLEQD